MSAAKAEQESNPADNDSPNYQKLNDQIVEALECMQLVWEFLLNGASPWRRTQLEEVANRHGVSFFKWRQKKWTITVWQEAANNFGCTYGDKRQTWLCALLYTWDRLIQDICAKLGWTVAELNGKMANKRVPVAVTVSEDRKMSSFETCPPIGDDEGETKCGLCKVSLLDDEDSGYEAPACDQCGIFGCYICWPCITEACDIAPLYVWCRKERSFKTPSPSPSEPASPEASEDESNNGSDYDPNEEKDPGDDEDDEMVSKTRRRRRGKNWGKQEIDDDDGLYDDNDDNDNDNNNNEPETGNNNINNAGKEASANDVTMVTTSSLLNMQLGAAEDEMVEMESGDPHFSPAVAASANDILEALAATPGPQGSLSVPIRELPMGDSDGVGFDAAALIQEDNDMLGVLVASPGPQIGFNATASSQEDNDMVGELVAAPMVNASDSGFEAISEGNDDMLQMDYGAIPSPSVAASAQPSAANQWGIFF